MSDRVQTALEAARKIRQSRGFSSLAPRERARLDRDLSALEGALTRDPYAEGLDLLTDRLRQDAQTPGAPAGQNAAPAAPVTPVPAAPGLRVDQLGRTIDESLQAIDFSGFVSSLITGSFQAIVDSSAQQIRRYAELVSSLSKTLGRFTEDHVDASEARQQLAKDHSGDLEIVEPPPGAGASSRLRPRSDSEGTSPNWLDDYGHSGEALTEDFVEGTLLESARVRVGENRIQALATMVLMGINRIVVDQGEVRAKLMFHAAARDTRVGQVAQQSTAIAERAVSSGAATQVAVSTVQANAQADSLVRADLMGEVRVTFRSETFPLERFADTAAIQLINTHARWRREEPEESSTNAASGDGGGEGAAT